MQQIMSCSFFTSLLQLVSFSYFPYFQRYNPLNFTMCYQVHEFSPNFISKIVFHGNSLQKEHWSATILVVEMKIVSTCIKIVSLLALLCAWLPCHTESSRKDMNLKKTPAIRLLCGSWVATVCLGHFCQLRNVNQNGGKRDRNSERTRRFRS